MKRTFTLLGALLAAPLVFAGDSDLETVVDWMTGSFNSAAQAMEDPDFYHITLEMAPIWSDGDNEYWLYVEQAAAEARDKPYRQRVYRVTELADGTIESAVYLLPEPDQAIGAWKADNPLVDVSPGDLELREGCSVFLTRVDSEVFAGETRGTECKSTLRGASYATSKVVVTPEGIQSWDQGFDADDQQVWGAEKGPYVFKRM